MAAKSLKKTVKEAARLGEGRDKIMAHLSPGEIVLPLNFQKKFPAVEAALRQSFAKAGIDYEQYVAGSAQNRINPRTGAPMFDDGSDGGGGNEGGNEGGYGGDPDGNYASDFGNDFNNDFSGFFGGDPNSENNSTNNEGGAPGNEGGLQSGDPDSGFFGGLFGGLFGDKGEADPESNLDEYGRDVRDIYGNEYIGDITGVTGSPSSPGSGRAEVDPTVDPDAPDPDAEDADAQFGVNSPGQLAFDSMMNTAVGLFTQGYLTQESTMDDVVSGYMDSGVGRSSPSANQAAALAAEDAGRAAVDAYLSNELQNYGVDPNETVDTAPNLSTADPTEDDPDVTSADFFDPVTSNYNVFGRDEFDAGRAALTSYVTSPDSVITNSFGLTAPSSDLSFLGPAYTGPNLANTELSPYGTLNPDFTPGVPGYVGTTFSGRLAGDERADVAPAVAPGPSYTEADIAGRTGNLTGLGKGAVSSGKGAASPGYDISTYGIDPYETISGAVQQGATTTDRDGTPDGGGEDVRRRLTEAEIQYLAEMGYLPGEAVPVSSSDTVRPAVAPITYDISKFLSRSNR